MDLDRTHYHRTTSSTSSTTSELFICFTSRLSSSSSMKISRSILSPGRSRDQPMSLPTSLSRRLRTNGSIKGGQASPMFPATGKKRGGAFENPEPSSPKVTCIGQVRVKTKKKAKQTRSLSRRHTVGEASFRRQEQSGGAAFCDSLSLKCDEKAGGFGQNQRYTRANSTNQQYPNHQQDCLRHRNQRWVHLPLTICEALRAFGAEFSCLLPCKSSCFSTSEREKEAKGNGSSADGNNGQSSCGAVFARWLVTLQDGEGGKGREIELVVGGDEDRTEVRERNITMRSSRRHVLEDFEIKDEGFDKKDQDGEEEEARVSISIPPKNALLLMRCRSDPMKMAALNNRFWEAPPPQDEKDGEEEEEEIDDDNRDLCEKFEEVVKEQENGQECEAREVVKDMTEENEVCEKRVSFEMDEFVDSHEKEEDLPMEEQEEKLVEELESSEVKMQEFELEEVEQETDLKQIVVEEEKEIGSSLASCGALVEDSESKEVEESNQIQKTEEVPNSLSCSSAVYLDVEDVEAEEDVQSVLAVNSAIVEETAAAEKAETESSSEEDIQELDCQSGELDPTHEKEEVQDQETEPIELKTEKEDEKEEHLEGTIEEKNSNSNSTLVSSSSSSVLPDCLLLMMCEPKLSMEVSKETWVCSTDFIRCLPQRYKQVKPPTTIKKDGNSDEVKKRVSIVSNNSGFNANKSQFLVPQQPAEALPPVPPRSSCSLPMAAVSMATMIEQKLVNAVGYEPFVLTRCKSEPRRTTAAAAAAKLAPDTCFWTKRKLEPLRRAAYQVGAAGVGF